MHLGKPGYAFFTSSMVILAFASLFSVAIFPNFMLSTIDPAYSVTLKNARSSQQTLSTMLVIAAHRDTVRPQLYRCHLLDLSRQRETRPP